MKTLSDSQALITFSPKLRADDACGNYWLRQVTIRLRREICWRWHQQDVVATTSAVLPPLTDRLTDSLDMSRYWEEKRHFYETDPTGKYLTDLLATDPPELTQPLRQGSFSWVVDTLALDDVSAFVLALGLIVSFDHAVGEVIAACLNDPNATIPTLALSQKLWDQPEAVLALSDSMHPLWRYGLLQSVQEMTRPVIGIDWHTPIGVPPLVANSLLFANSVLPQILVPISEEPAPLNNSAWLVALRLSNQPADALRVVPVRSGSGATPTDIIAGISQITRRAVVTLKGYPALTENSLYLKSLVTLCWLHGLDLFIQNDLMQSHESDKGRSSTYLLPLQSIPTTIFLGIRDRGALTHLPSHLLLPIVHVLPLSYLDRVQCWQQALGTTNTSLDKGIAECSRRFRYEKGTIQAICDGLRGQGDQLAETDLITACRAELDLDIGELAQEVMPRFIAEELVLPPKQQVLFQEIYQAMKSLTEVHYGWGTAKVWNECGISVLFAGPPGTGKTMAAEILAVKLELPMYRIDLSQVVNKYIGETEKNLKRLFDLADVSDTLLFFDEADALFGRRTEVKDAHDRYANLEISYLLERMERFKGLAILATNRKKDLDEAFLRRLRYIVDFPLPDIRERHRIWRQAIPEKVDASQLDFNFLAKQFSLTGGHIRSIIFNACLQTADGLLLANFPAQLTMAKVLIAVKREHEKLGRAVGLEQFGPYAKLIEELDHA
jgi:ATPase family associated with various cellular activities (AAA)